MVNDGLLPGYAAHPLPLIGYLSQEAGGGNQSAAALLSGAGESELEAKVRLGEVTPFGTDLSAVTTETARSVRVKWDHVRSAKVASDLWDDVGLLVSKERLIV